MNQPSSTLASATRLLSPALTAVLQKLQPGQRIRVTQTVRVGFKEWTTTITGTYRGFNYLVTGIATDRVPRDDIVVVTVHFVKDNRELSSVTLDENSKIEVKR